ncbi:MAG TPA: ABC transporter ATP-binding protein/permease, partial [Acetobacteraceae bacterium]
PGFCLVAAVYIVVAVYRTYLNQWLQIRWRRWMTEVFLDRWLADRAYYRISLTGSSGAGTDNPDQRIAEDLRDFVRDGLSLGLDLLSNVVSLFSFVTILWTLSGSVQLWGIDIPGYMVWVALIYAALGSSLTHLIGAPLAALNFRQQRVEADFRFALVRLRENAEGVALYNGEAQEHRGLAQRFAALAENWWAIMRRTKMLNGMIAGYSQAAVVFPIIVAAPRYFSGQMQLGELTQTAGAFGQVQTAMSWFVTSYASLAAWRATVHRLASFDAAIDQARAAGAGGIETVPTDGRVFELESAELSLPDGRKLLSSAGLRLAPGQSVIVTGRSGSGKSTLFRALAGIWPFGTGRVKRPAGRAMFLPQRPYLPLGTLREVLCYPDPPTQHSDAELVVALREAGLGHLESSLEEALPWSQSLSGGEQQRLALVRALLAKPDWLFLDEATASLDPAGEADLYATLRRALPATTIVSIAHRPTVAQFHDRHISFERGEAGPGRLVEVEAKAAE